MNKKIKSVTIGVAVKDVEDAVAWYKSLLGDVTVMEPAPGTVELQLTDDVWLQFDDTGYLEAGGSVIRLETEDIDAVHNLVKQIAFDVGNIETVEGAVRYFDFKDLAGNKLSYYQSLE